MGVYVILSGMSVITTPRTAMEGVDYVIHAAALKQVACRIQTFEAVKTNVIGSQNV